MNILITGAGGYLGKSLKNHLHNRDINVTCLTRADLDLTNTGAVSDWFKNKQFDFVFHTAITGGNRLIEDDVIVIYENIKLFTNLWSNRHRFNKLISFGSGAEVGNPTTPYGISKYIINAEIQNTDNFYNIRLYGLFDENENDTRFIKSNIIRYLNNEDLIIYKDRYMDFFYMGDLLYLIDNYYLKGNEPPPKIFECCYVQKFTLTDIATMINDLDDYNVDIRIVNKNSDRTYIGAYKNKEIAFPFGLERGIKRTYKELKIIEAHKTFNRLYP